jgi:GDP-4-dehydro-6-deoxy-D-mannose reductase
MPAPRILVTGATGFVGGWTLRHWQIHHPETEVWACSEKPRPPQIACHEYRQVDLCDRAGLRRLVQECRPARVIHLAGLIGPVPLKQHLVVNVVGTENLYVALAEFGEVSTLRLVQSSSAAVYGPVASEELPIRETQPPRPITAYALSKLAQDYLAAAMWRTKGLAVVTGRVFNLLGPGQPDGLVPMTFVRQLQEVRAGRAGRLETGRTDARRDFVDVRDVVTALDLILEKGEPGEVYNIASGSDVSIQDVIDQLLVTAGLKVPLSVAPARLRASDVLHVRADISKLEKVTGWRPTISLADSLRAMWESEVGGEGTTAAVV